MELPKRKPTRLSEYDYFNQGAYFVTICVKDMKCILSNIIVGEGLRALPQIDLTSIGQIVEESICYMQTCYNCVSIDKYVIMPNHIHLLVSISDTGGRGSPPLHKIIGQFKSYTTKIYNGVLWQRSFYDHIIRGKEDYDNIWNYIDTNPQRWILKRETE